MVSEAMAMLQLGIYNAHIPESEKFPMRVMHNTRALISAGLETTATSLKMTTWKVSNDVAMLRRLKAVLATAAGASGLNFLDTLQKLSSLTRLVKHGHRPERLRLRKNLIIYKDFAIPLRMIVGMDISGVSWNADVFPDPMRFDPEMD